MTRRRSCSSLKSRPERDLSKGRSSLKSRSPLKGGHEHLSSGAQVPPVLLSGTGLKASEQTAVEIEFRVGRYTCAMRYPLPAGSGQLQAEWQPEVPGKLTAAEIAQYRAGRDELLTEVARQTGLNIAVVEP